MFLSYYSFLVSKEVYALLYNASSSSISLLSDSFLDSSASKLAVAVFNF